MIYRSLGGGRCRFVLPSGKLTRPRSCRRPVEYLASGRGAWHMQLRIALAPGPYLVRSEAVDGNRRHQVRTAASVKLVEIRGAVAARVIRTPNFTG